MAEVRKALLVGIDDYVDAPLNSCVKDAEAMADVLRHHDDNENCYSTLTFTSDGADEITRSLLREKLIDLFATEDADVLFYFSGHGAPSPLGAELVTVDYTGPSSWGVSMGDIAELANASHAKSATIILDCCFSGAFGSDDNTGRLERFGTVTLRAGVTLLAASSGRTTADASSGEVSPFTRVLVEGLSGMAANIHGDVTATSLFGLAQAAFTDGWGPHPVLKCHSLGTPVLRRCHARVERAKLRKLSTIFATTSCVDATDIGDDPTGELFAAYTGVGLVIREDSDDGRVRYELTASGHYYRRLAADGLI